MKYGYARISSCDQHLDLQAARLRAQGCEVVIEEIYSGRDVNGRELLLKLIEDAQPGDEIMCVKIDRLARSLRDVLNIVHTLAEKQVTLRILEPDVSTGGAVGNLVLTVFAMVGELELSIMKERQKVGIARARLSAGKYIGRRRAIAWSTVGELWSKGTSSTDISKTLGISRGSVYRILSALKRGDAIYGRQEDQPREDHPSP
jgi:DNA invertase Pin-like site-specific DNA recombinase